MYSQGLNYLLESQDEWNENLETQPAIVSFALMAVMARGENFNHPKFKPYAEKCIDLIINNQDQDSGFIGTSMYNHGFTTLALSECYGLVDDPRLAPALKKAVDLIISAQESNPKNAWRYTPNSPDADSTVTGCQLVALLGARNAGIPVPASAISKGLAYMESCRSSDGSYGYTNNNNGRPTLTAIGILTHRLAQKKDDEGYQRSLEYLTRRLNYRDQHYPFYFEYYMSQALFQANIEAWADWNKRNIRYLKVIQNNDGSWSDRSANRVYSTSAALLSLALNYRFLPIYEKF